MRVCCGLEAIGIHPISRLDDFTGINKVLPRIAGDWHESRDGVTPVGDLDRFPRGYFFEILAGVLPQLPHPYRSHVLHCSTFCGWRRASRRSASRPCWRGIPDHGVTYVKCMQAGSTIARRTITTVSASSGHRISKGCSTATKSTWPAVVRRLITAMN